MQQDWLARGTAILGVMFLTVFPGGVVQVIERPDGSYQVMPVTHDPSPNDFTIIYLTYQNAAAR